MLKYVVWRIIVKLKNTKDMEDWIDMGKVKGFVKQSSGTGTIHYYPLFMKIIDGVKYYKFDGEHVKVLDKEEAARGFSYNAVSASYYIYIV